MIKTIINFLTIKYKIFFCIVIFLNLIWINQLYSFADNNLVVTFLDIGQGDSILIQTPDNKTMLIDAGPDITVLSKLSEELPFWDREIDLILLTHPDLDHVGGFPELIRNYNVENVLYDLVDHKSFAYNEFNRLIETKAITSWSSQEYRNLRLGCCVYLNILWPFRGEDLSKYDPNDVSLSIELIYKNTNFYLAGDLSKDLEDEILDSDSFLDVDLMKAGHHGSKTSTSPRLLEQLSPEVVVYTAGEDNRFGHPNEEVIDLVNKFGIPSLSTLGGGNVRVVSDGERIYY